MILLQVSKIHDDISKNMAENIKILSEATGQILIKFDRKSLGVTLLQVSKIQNDIYKKMFM